MAIFQGGVIRLTVNRILIKISNMLISFKNHAIKPKVLKKAIISEG